ncbi:hypothetical protein EJ06DRAFT_474966 [Trichodelitschia bisporula]|uniref:Tat pathway signal sequence n=1 Tax=Trichodelitschia bisporula TaxID=703511 RepID=A0A6G1I133_9PEZI|nr:hypothetical protein EJ06DRAFT_474966 [Trichodelitschia bisporula]
MPFAPRTPSDQDADVASPRFPRGRGYTDEEQAERLLADEKTSHIRDDTSPTNYARLSFCARYALPLCAVLFVASAVNLFLALRRPSDEACAARTSLWSPALPAVRYIEYDFANSFGQKSPYRGPPTPEREALWDELVFQHAVEIPANRVPTNHTSSKLRRLPSGGYAALLEVFHQLHCLNRIRQYTWLQSGNYNPNDEDTEGVHIPHDFRTNRVANRMHIDHCIETLRLTLMCHGDVTPVMILEDGGSVLGRRAEFSARHVCRDFRAIQRWVGGHVAEL